MVPPTTITTADAAPGAIGPRHAPLEHGAEAARGDTSSLARASLRSTVDVHRPVTKTGLGQPAERLLDHGHVRSDAAGGPTLGDDRHEP